MCCYDSNALCCNPAVLCTLAFLLMVVFPTLLWKCLSCQKKQNPEQKEQAEETEKEN
jgi:hypothetical protein